MQPISLDLRERIVRVYQEEEATQQEVADRFQVSVSSVKRFLRVCRKTGKVEARPPGGGTPGKLHEIGQHTLKEVAHRQKDWIQEEMAEELAARTGIEVSQPTISRYLERLGITRKKKRNRRQNENERM
jgi:transposase